MRPRGRLGLPPTASRGARILRATRYGAILVGGRSSRFGAPKSDARLGDRTILDRIVEAHRAAGLEPVLVGGRATVTGSDEPPRIEDRFEGRGPLGGLHAALTWAQQRGSSGVCVTACDTPFLEPTLLMALATIEPDVDVTVAAGSAPGEIEPLIGRYSCRLISAIEEMLEAGELAMRGLLQRADHVRIVTSAEISLARPWEQVLLNINTVASLERARTILAKAP